MGKERAVKIAVDEKFGMERCLKKFKRLCESYGVVKEYRKRQEYKKPSVMAKEKKVSADKRRKKTVVKYRRVSKI